jgi:hypothetical protein
MKVALCFIISYEHILNKEELWINWIKPNKDIINVYFHYKNIKKIKSEWIRLYAISPKFIKNTSYYNVVPAYMSVLTYAYHHDTNNKWFCLLTDSCVPIISPEKFREMFNNYYVKSIIKCKPAYWNISLHHRANLRALTKEFWLANDPWFTICRDHVHKCILFLTHKTDTFNTINMGGLANESIFAIILQTFNEISNPKKVINESATLCDWSRMSTPTSPYVFKDASIENINIIYKLLKENKYAMFLRKVDRDFPDTAILGIMNSERELFIGKKRHKKCLVLVGPIILLVCFYATLFFTKYFMYPNIFTYNM